MATSEEKARAFRALMRDAIARRSFGDCVQIIWGYLR